MLKNNSNANSLQNSLKTIALQYLDYKIPVFSNRLKLQPFHITMFDISTNNVCVMQLYLFIVLRV